jgi:hypothetical protein
VWIVWALMSVGLMSNVEIGSRFWVWLYDG